MADPENPLVDPHLSIVMISFFGLTVIFGATLVVFWVLDIGMLGQADLPPPRTPRASRLWGRFPIQERSISSVIWLSKPDLNGFEVLEAVEVAGVLFLNPAGAKVKSKQCTTWF